MADARSERCELWPCDSVAVDPVQGLAVLLVSRAPPGDCSAIINYDWFTCFVTSMHRARSQTSGARWAHVTFTNLHNLH